MRDATLFHYSGHAIRYRNEVALVLSPDPDDPDELGRRGLYLLKASEHHPMPRMMTFSACSTGVYESTDTLLPGQLANTALLAGAKIVVASLWDVDSTATASWMQAFYQVLRSGKDPTSAAAKANTVIQQHPGWSHPYYWAPFAIFEAGI